MTLSSDVSFCFLCESWFEKAKAINLVLHFAVWTSRTARARIRFGTTVRFKSVLSFNRFSILNNSLITLRIRSRINIQIPPLKIYVIRGLQNLHKIRIKIAVLISLFYRKFQFHFNRNSRRIFLPWNFRRTQNRTQWIISLSLSNSLSIACTLSSHRWFGRSASGFPLGNTVTILSQQCKSVTKRPDQVTAICRVTTLTRFPIYSRWSTRRDHFSSTPEGNLSPDKAVST